jgi:hypothetical protein
MAPKLVAIHVLDRNLVEAADVNSVVHEPKVFKFTISCMSIDNISGKVLLSPRSVFAESTSAPSSVKLEHPKCL